jgi:hypothetical protein
MTLPAHDDAALVEAQRSFHLAAGVAAVVDPAEIGSAGADWVLPAAAGEFWWPRGASLDAVLRAIPAEYHVVQALARPFLRPVGAGEADVPTHRLSAQAMLADPLGSPRPTRRLAHRAGVDVAGYEGEIPKGSLRPLRGWYPIEVLTIGGEAIEEKTIALGVENGTVQVDTRLRDALGELEAGNALTFSRPTIVDNAWYAVDAAVLGEADAFRLRADVDDLERRIASLEETFALRVERKLRATMRRGSRQE